jgi:uncharacterized protein (TIGR02231 family)
MATPVTLPVTRVVVMEDRAQVERRGPVTLTGGLQRLEVLGLPLLAVDRSLKVEVTGATLADAKLTRRWKEKPQGGLPADASELRKKVKALEEVTRHQADALKRLEIRRDGLAQARADLLRGIAQGVGAGRAEPKQWAEQLELVSTQQVHAEDELRLLQREAEKASRFHGEGSRALAMAEERLQDLECLLALNVDGSGTATVRVSYLVPCAVWRPAYRASLQGDTVLLESEAVVWQRTGEPWSGVELAFSTARPTLGTTPPSLQEDRVFTRPKAEEEKKVVDVSIREEEIPTSGESGGGGSDMPGLDDGGEARLLEAPAKCSVPSDGAPHRIPLAKFEAKAELERVCPAELTELVSLVARFPNAGSQVLLAGPVDLIRQAGFVGRSQLKFAAPGETLKLSFGSEDGLRVVRESEEKRDESRLTGRKTRKRMVTLHVSNASPDTHKIVVEERLPVSEVKEVEIALQAKECEPLPSVSKEGIARIELQLAPNGTRKAKLTWELSAAGKVAGV